MSKAVREILETAQNEKLNAQAIDPNVPTTSGATPNYGLPQWSGNDITDWFELNPAFSKIDEAMNANAVAADTAQKTGDSNTASIANLTESLNSTITRVTNVENVNTQQTQQITLNTTHLNEHDTSIQANATAIAALQEAESGTSGDVAALQADVKTLQGQMTTANNNIATNADAIGNLTELETTVKTDLVSAVNEIIGGSGSGEGATLADIGNLADLETTDKSNLVAAINEVFSGNEGFDVYATGSNRQPLISSSDFSGLGLSLLSVNTGSAITGATELHNLQVSVQGNANITNGFGVSTSEKIMIIPEGLELLAKLSNRQYGSFSASFPAMINPTSGEIQLVASTIKQGIVGSVTISDQNALDLSLNGQIFVLVRKGVSLTTLNLTPTLSKTLTLVKQN